MQQNRLELKLNLKKEKISHVHPKMETESMVRLSAVKITSTINSEEMSENFTIHHVNENI
jgi:hypothetical protein